MIQGNQSALPLRWDGRARSLQLAVVQRITVAQAGWLMIDNGQVWLTRDGQGEDMVLGGGERTWLAAGEMLVAEPWLRGAPAQLTWLGNEADAAAPMVLDPGALQAVQGPLRQTNGGWTHALWRAAWRGVVRLQFSAYNPAVS